jgi:hypothetical protein
MGDHEMLESMETYVGNRGEDDEGNNVPPKCIE